MSTALAVLPNAFGQPCMSGFGATSAQLARQQKRAANQAARQAKRTGVNPAASAAAKARMQQAISQLTGQHKKITADLLSSSRELAAANRAVAQAARMVPPPPPVRRLRGLGAAPTSPALQRALSARAAAVSRAKARLKAGTAFGNTLRQSHGGILPHNVTPRGAVPIRKAGMRGFGYIDPVTGIDDGMGDPGYTVDPGYVDPGIYDPNSGFAPPPYTDPNTFGGGVGMPNLSASSLVPGFGLPFMSQMSAPSGCRNGSSAPRCLIFEMAQQDRQQMMFVFTVMQQMYAQLLQIVQQLMQQLAVAQQQPAPYYGPQGYGQGYGNPYDPYGQYGANGPYPGPMGYPGQPYAPGYGDSSAIPPGYGDGGGMFDSGMMIPQGDISQIFPGPGPMQAGPLNIGPQVPNIISSDSLPDGSGPGTQDTFGGEESFVPAFTPAPSVSVAPAAPATQTFSQAVNAGPKQPYLIIQPQSPGQSPYADAMLPAGEGQDQPSLEPPTEIESWAESNW